MKESDLQSQIMNYCMYSHDLWALRINTGVLKSKNGFYKSIRSSIPRLSKGIPDVFIFLKGCGKVIFVECKTDTQKFKVNKDNELKVVKYKGKQSPDQIVCEQFCKDFALPYVLAYTLDDVKSAIEAARLA